MRSWVSPKIRNEVIDFVLVYSQLTDLAISRLIGWIGIGPRPVLRVATPVWPDQQAQRFCPA